MKLQPAIAKALNEHATVEASAAFSYLSMASWFDNKGLKGFAKWCQSEASGEFSHMNRFLDYINTRGGQVRFGAIPAPAHDWPNALDLFEAVYQQEADLTQRLGELVGLVRDHGDRATDFFLNEFMSEQIEDEAMADDLLTQIKMVDNDPQGMLLINNELLRSGAP